jgi:hypothetical protein
MQTSGQQAITSVFNNREDLSLWSIKELLSLSYWSSPGGVFEFQFIIDNMILTNVLTPYIFQLIRYTPDYVDDEAFKTSIPGRLNGDGSVEYGGGILGKLIGNNIMWVNGDVWTKVSNIPERLPDILDLGVIRSQAIVNTNKLMNDIYLNNYLY